LNIFTQEYFRSITKKTLSQKFIWPIVITTFIYQLYKSPIILSIGFVSIVLISTISIFFISKKKYSHTLLTSLILISFLARINLPILESTEILSASILMLTLANSRLWFLQIICIFLTPQYFLVCAFLLSSGLLRTVRNKKLLSLLNFAPILFIIIYLCLSNISIEEIIKHHRTIFDLFLKPMNILFLLGAILYSLKEEANSVLPILLSTFTFSFPLLLSPEPNIFYISLITVAFCHYLRSYKNDLVMNNLLLLVWFLFGALF
jgi:hypothetical protein